MSLVKGGVHLTRASKHVGKKVLSSHESAIQSSRFEQFPYLISSLNTSATTVKVSGACGGDSCFETVQPRLKVRKPGDRYEQEADRIAAQMMRMTEPGLQRQPT
jgi:hypothetical protein